MAHGDYKGVLGSRFRVIVENNDHHDVRWFTDAAAPATDSSRFVLATAAQIVQLLVCGDFSGTYGFSLWIPQTSQALRV